MSGSVGDEFAITEVRENACSSCAAIARAACADARACADELEACSVDAAAVHCGVRGEISGGEHA